MRKLASTMGVLALIGACTSESGDGGNTGGTTGNGGTSAKGGTAGLAGEGGESNSGQGGKAPAQGGVGGKATQSGGAAPEGGASTEGGIGGVAGIGGEGGMGGSGGDAGSAGAPSEPVTSTDTCAGAEPTPNDTRGTATAYKLGSAYTACLQSETDIDVYAFEVPNDNRGGYVTVSVTDVGTNGDISFAAYTASDNTKLVSSWNADEGGSAYLFFNAKPGAKYYVAVTNYADSPSANAYTFRAIYKRVLDIYEPNDLRSSATPVPLGGSTSAYLFAGWEYATGIPEEEWQDWYKVELEPGDVDVLVTTGAADLTASLVLYDSLGGEIAAAHNATEGSDVHLAHSVSMGGTYFIKIEPYLAPATRGSTATVPQYLKVPYSLEVTQ
ncbi:MAG: hypothetical protein ACOY0T_02490 [Myxococcota bacterium]